MSRRRHKKIMETDVHHLVSPKVWWDDSEINRKLMNRLRHDAIHRLFNNDPPLKQLITIIMDNEQVLVDEFRKQMIEKIVLWWESAYKHWVLIKNKKR